VITTKETKGKKRRVVFIGSELVAVLQDMLAVRREHGIEDGGWLFLVPPPRRGRYATRTEPRPPHRKTVHDWHEHALQDAGLDDLPLHGLRHTAAARGCRPVVRSNSFEPSSVTRL
jgi:integrase